MEPKNILAATNPPTSKEKSEGKLPVMWPFLTIKHWKVEFSNRTHFSQQIITSSLKFLELTNAWDQIRITPPIASFKILLMFQASNDSAMKKCRVRVILENFKTNFLYKVLNDMKYMIDIDEPFGANYQHKQSWWSKLTFLTRYLKLKNLRITIFNA